MAAQEFTFQDTTTTKDEVLRNSLLTSLRYLVWIKQLDTMRKSSRITSTDCDQESFKSQGLKPEGFVHLTMAGKTDRRFRTGSKPQGPRVSRLAGVAHLKSNSWEFVREGFSTEGVHSHTGAKLKHYFVIRDKITQEEVFVGFKALKKSTRVILPGSLPKVSTDFSNHFSP